MNDDRREWLARGAALAGLSALGAGPGAGLAFGQAASSANRPGIAGHPAPEIALDYWIDGEGEPTEFSVLEARGKWVFLKCFQNWCPGCHASGFPTLKAFADAFHGHPDVAIAGIQTVFEGHAINTRDAVRELQVRYDLPNVMGHDPGDPESHGAPLTMRHYRTGGTPWLILIEPGGTVLFDGFHVDPDKLIAFVGKQLA